MDNLNTANSSYMDNLNTVANRSYMDNLNTVANSGYTDNLNTVANSSYMDQSHWIRLLYLEHGCFLFSVYLGSVPFYFSEWKGQRENMNLKR